MHRDALNHPLLADPARFKAWFWLISHAAWKDMKYDNQGSMIDLRRGQLCVSRSQLATAWKWSPSAVERFLTRLKTEQMIGQATGQGKSIITICNYDKFQHYSEQPGQATGQATGQLSDRDRTAKNKYNKETKKNNNTGAPVKPDFVKDSVWADFLQMRRAKHAPLTQTALAGIEREASKAGWKLDDALAECVTRGWQGFKADWVSDQFPPNHSGIPI